MREDQEQTIRAEEHIRITAREEHESRPDGRKPLIWRALNAPLLVAFIPSIALVLLPVLFSALESAKDAERYRQRIDAELVGRVEIVLGELSRKHDKGWDTYDQSAENRFHEFLSQAFKVHPATKFIFPEFEDWPMKAMLLERLMSLPDSENSDVTIALRSLECIEKHLSTPPDDTSIMNLDNSGKIAHVKALFDNAYGALEEGFSSWFPPTIKKEGNRSCKS